MNKAELLTMITEKSNLTKAQVETSFKAIFDTIAEVLSNEGKLMIPGFGGFTAKNRAERKGRNPSTGQEIIIPAAKVASFKPSTQLKDLINGTQGEK